MKIALALFPFLKDLSNDLEGTLNKIKDMGYQGVEFALGLKYNPDRLREALQKANLELVGWHIDKSYLDEDLFESTVYYMKAVGNSRLIIPWLPDTCTDSMDSWKKTAEEFNNLGNRLQEHGIKIGYHNHQKEFVRTDTGYLFDGFCENTNENIILQLDIGNMLSAGAAPEVFLEKYPDRFQTIHIKPYSLHTGFDTMIGMDSINYHKIIENCESISGTEWVIVEYEVSTVYDSYEGAAKCFENLCGFMKHGLN